MTIRLTEDSRLLLPRELIVGRLVMIAALAIPLQSAISSLGIVSAGEQRVITVLLLVMTASWIWFWWCLAAGPESTSLVTAVTGIVLSAVAIVVVNPVDVSPLYFAAIVVGAAFRWQLGVPLVAGVTVLILVTSSLAVEGGRLLEAGLIASLLGGASVAVRRYVAAQLALAQSQEEIRRLASQDARLDFARDLHDQLGQQLTVSVLQAELLVQDVAQSSSLIRERAATILASSRSALQLMRRTVQEVREPDVEAELAAAQTLLTAAGIACTINRQTTVDSTATATTLGWVVRESVTNVLRHSRATQCSILLCRDEKAYYLTVDDDGHGPQSADHGSGLVNMRARITDLGGNLTASPRNGSGFRVVATAPVEQ